MLLDSPQIGTTRGPQPKALTGSLALHAALIGWMFFGPSLGTRTPQQAPKNAYQQLIAGNEKKLVWYNFRDKLPEVSPLERHGISQPPRSQAKSAKQTIVANPPGAKRAKQMVYLPAAPQHLESEVPAPNLLAFAVPKIPPPEKPSVKLFAPPPDVIAKLVPPEPLPEAPQVTTETAKLDLPQPEQLRPREFVPPVEAKREAATPAAVPDAPKVVTAEAAPQLPPRRFVPPPERKPAAAPAQVPEAPKIGPAQASVNLPQPQRLRAREFVPPPERKPAATPAQVPEAPKIGPAQAGVALPQPQSLRARIFFPPPDRKPVAPPPQLPDAPKVGPAHAGVALPQPQSLRARIFFPPPDRKPAAPAQVPDAPKIASASANVSLPSAPKLGPRPFVPPTATVAGRAAGSAPSTPDAPQVGSAGGNVTLPTAPKLAPREFVAPPQTSGSGSTGSGSIPDAPKVAGGTAAPGALPSAPRLPPREFNAPADGKPSPSTAAAVLPDAPQVVEGAPPESAPAGSLTAAIIGLQPAPELKALPEAASPADVSSAPNPRKNGGTGEPVESAKLFVPNLMIRDGAMADTAATLVKGIVKTGSSPTSLDNIMEAAKTAPVIRPVPGLTGVFPAAVAPDPSFSGRAVYMASIQMPTITSFIGSWIMWFADREPMPGEVREMRPPVPVRKVDPKYVASAAAERVQGKVQLSAVIRRDGRIESVSVLKHLDDRLDFSAAEALRKWEFEPARRDGRPVDVDAVFEIPFQLEPLAKR